MKLDHITVIAPTLAEGVVHVRNCLDLDVPFGTRHNYMGTYNHRLQLGNDTYLEIVALDPEGTHPPRARWFGLDNEKQVRKDWDSGHRLRSWVANTDQMDRFISTYPHIFGEKVSLPFDRPEFDFSIPQDGSLPMAGALPSLIDHRGTPTSMNDIPDMGARLYSLTLEHPEPNAITRLYTEMGTDDPFITIHEASALSYIAQINTPNGLKNLT